MRRPWPALGCGAIGEKRENVMNSITFKNINTAFITQVFLPLNVYYM